MALKCDLWNKYYKEGNNKTMNKMTVVHDTNSTLMLTSHFSSRSVLSVHIQENARVAVLFSL